MTIKKNWITNILALQDHICKAIEEEDGKAVFIEENWIRPEGGGGRTRVISNGDFIEKGGVNTSTVYGEVNDAMRRQMKLTPGVGSSWFACGLSIVLHPFSPHVPTVHCNYRMFELYNEQGGVIDRWFGGGTDLTPYYIVENDIIHFHTAYKNVCDGFDKSYYPAFKKACDDYFVNTHRSNERRGVGGIFYDYKKAPDEQTASHWMELGLACGHAFIPAWLPIVQHNKQLPFTPQQKHWQEIRRGRYVEFNLVHDRGTLFGLKTNGRIESIFMSLPPTVRFEYNYQPEKNSPEDELLQICLQPRDWLKTGDKNM
ncbi:MAG: oxygen-dependent coproporphyrinogen oxidase [Bacteroidota bacterium]